MFCTANLTGTDPSLKNYSLLTDKNRYGANDQS
jgi:hypothetical protein